MEDKGFNPDGHINGRAFAVANTTPNRLKQLDDADEMLRKYNDNHDTNYLFDPEFRGKYLKAVADVVMEFENGKSPNAEYFSDGDLEVSTIQDARTAFLGRGGMIVM